MKENEGQSVKVSKERRNETEKEALETRQREEGGRREGEGR